MTVTKKPPVYSNWEQIDQALRELSEIELEQARITLQMNEVINEARAAALEQTQPLQARQTEIEKDVKAFVQRHKGELSGKSRKLNFGAVGYRYSSSVSLPRDQEAYQQIVATLVERGMNECVSIERPKINRDLLKQYGEKVVREVGATWKASDRFFCENDLEKVRSTV